MFEADARRSRRGTCVCVVHRIVTSRYLPLRVLALPLAVVWLPALVLAYGAAEPMSLGPQTSAVGPASTRERLRQLGAMIVSDPRRAPDAIPELKSILGADPLSAEAHMLLGMAYRALGTFEMRSEAVAELRQAIALQPSLAPARWHLAGVYLDMNRPERAKSELETALAQSPGQPQYLARLAEATRRLGQPQRAVDMARQALATDPSAREARRHLALALLDLGRREESVSEFERLISLGNTDPEVYLTLGATYLDVGQIDAGLKTLVQAALALPDRPDVRVQLARAYRLRGSLADAEAQLSIPVPASTAIQAPLFYQRVLADLSVERGLIRLAQGRPNDAIVSWRQAIEADPNHEAAHRHLAETYRQQGQAATARDHEARADAIRRKTPPKPVVP